MPRPKKQKSPSRVPAKKSTIAALPVRDHQAANVGGGKRTNIRDAHDKYANQDVSY